jgi:hypothetical protein
MLSSPKGMGSGTRPRRRLAMTLSAAILLVAGLTVVPTGLAAPPAAGGATAPGAFVIGDTNATIGSTVTFWGAQWWKDNTLSGGLAPASFKGFADTASSPPVCGQKSWTTRPGNSSNPPATVAPIIDVIVSSAVSKDGPTISGDVTAIAQVMTDPGYAADPGHPGTGTVLSVTSCQDGGPI